MMSVVKNRVIGLVVLLAGYSVHAATVTWTGAQSTDWNNGLNWDNNIGPTIGDVAYINSGTVTFVSGTSSNLNALRLLGGSMTISGGTFKADNHASWDSHVEGTLTQTNGSTTFNELEVGRTPGDSGAYLLTGGDMVVSRGLNGYSLYLGGNKSGGNAGVGTFTISGGLLITRTGVKLGNGMLTGTGTFNVLGSRATQIGIGAGSNLDGWWDQHANSTLRVGIDAGGLTKISIDDDSIVGGTYATFHNGSLLDVGYYNGGCGGGTWTVMEVENGSITNNGLAFAPAVNTNIWSFNIDNSGSNGRLTVTAVGEPANQILLTVGDEKKQIMKYGLDYERLWFWYGSTANKNLVAQWSVVDCEIDYMRVAINCAYELTEGSYDLSAYTDKIIPMMTAMQAANPKVKFFGSPRPLDEAIPGARWQPYPTWITGDNGSSFNFDWQKCAGYLVRYVILMKSYGFRIHYIDFSNEWNYVTPTHVRDISDYMKGELGNDMPLVVAPSAWSFSQGVSWFFGANTTSTRAAIDIAACHNTGKQGTPQDFADKAMELGKEVWDSEVHGWKGSTPTDEIPNSYQMFDRIRAGFTGLDSWLTIGTTAQGHCYILNDGTTVTRNLKYYIFQKLCNTANYGRALDINQPSEFTSTAALIRENLLTVWVLNTTSGSQPIKIHVGNRVIADSAVRQTRWNESIALDGVGSTILAGSVTNMSATIEGNSLYCFEITLEPTGAEFPFLQAESYSDMSGITVQPCLDAGGGEMVGFPAAGGEISFNVDVTRHGCYDLAFRVASASANIQFDLYDGTNVAATVDRIATGGPQNWTTLYKTVSLNGGSTTLKVRATGGGWNLNWLECSAVFVPPIPGNLALNQAATASNVHSAGYEADKAVDGGISTRWATSVRTPWLEVDFGTPVPVNGISVRDYGNRTKAYEIHYYDGIWKTAYLGGDPDDGVVYSFPTVTGTKLRLQVTISTGDPSIWEFEIYHNPYYTDANPISTIALGGNAVSISWSGVPGSTYALQRSTNLVTDAFATLESGIPGQQSTNTATMAMPHAAAFYRVIFEQKD